MMKLERQWERFGSVLKPFGLEKLKDIDTNLLLQKVLELGFYSEKVYVIGNVPMKWLGQSILSLHVMIIFYIHIYITRSIMHGLLSLFMVVKYFFYIKDQTEINSSSSLSVWLHFSLQLRFKFVNKYI